ncbi:hydroxyacid dehydrogenase [Paenibacillus swuensis]|uniref:hydroxyacid dehydrogenase n=1 Tax=Paenibacillus swuensis TaxID=1178515 RepID=UPI0008383CC6|nr:hydroxyacid dehydrogenase [Paenibacillus swuensis]
MRTLIGINNQELMDMFFQEQVLNNLRTFSDVDMFEIGEGVTSEDLAERIAPYDAYLTSWGSPRVTAEVLARGINLKYVGHVAGTVVAVVNEDIYDTNIIVASANPVLAKSTAEAAVALMMAGAWDLTGYRSRLQQGTWCNNAKDTVMGLGGQTIGLIGYGEISSNVIAFLKGFPVTIKLFSRYCTQEQAEAMGVKLCGLEELLSTSQIVSLHNTWTSSTEGMIGARELALMQNGTLFVNTARARIVDERALLDELQSGRLFAAIDVYHNEPLLPDSPLLQLDNVLCVPHIGGFARKYKTAMGDFVVEDLKRFTAGDLPRGLVTREGYSRSTSF